MAAQGYRSSDALDETAQDGREHFFEGVFGELSTLGIPSETGDTGDSQLSEPVKQPALDDRSIARGIVTHASVNQHSSGHVRPAECIWPARQDSRGGDELINSTAALLDEHEREITGRLHLRYEQDQKVRIWMLICVPGAVRVLKNEHQVWQKSHRETTCKQSTAFQHET